jgi:hypothetical protein
MGLLSRHDRDESRAVASLFVAESIAKLAATKAVLKPRQEARSSQTKQVVRHSTSSE